MERFVMRQMLSVLLRNANVGILAASFAATAGPASAQIHLAFDQSAGVQAGAAQPADTVRRLTPDEAVALALEHNLGIQIARVNPQIQDVGVAQARSFWAPSLLSTVQRQNQTLASTSSLSGGATSVVNGSFAGSLGVSQELPWGASYTANWGSNRLTTTNLFSSFSPQLNSNLNLQYTQPLLRNLKIDNIRQTVKLSKKSREMSDVDLHTAMVQTARQVKNAYWDLVYQIDNLKAARQSLELAQTSLRDNTRRVEIGTMAPIDIVDAKAEVARNEEAVIIAQAQIEQAQDLLKTLIFDPATPNFWNVRIDPAETAPYQARAIDVDAAVRNALDKRTDLRQAKNQIQQSDISLQYFRNQILPDVNGYVSYITTGVGGEQLSPVDFAAIAAGLTPNRAVVASRGFGSVLGDVFQGTYPNWTAGFQIGYPLGTSTAKANLERAKLQYQQSQIQMKNLEMQAVAQVRNSARQVEANQKRVESARASRELAEEKLAAEEKKFAAGIRETFFVFQAQRDLATARSAEVRAIADYNKSLVDFEAVQEISLGGGFGGGITTAGAGAIQTGNSAIIRQGGN
jgi:outer membrane protein TolC